MSTLLELNFQNRNSPVIQIIVKFHDHLIVIITVIITFILYVSINLITRKRFFSKIRENQNIEFIWTIIPAIFLITLALPSIKILYIIEERKPIISLKAIGHQWYWSYEYPDFNVEFESYIQKREDPETFRVLDVDNRVVLPILSKIRLIVSSDDVIHSWAMPSLAIKIDAVPGRLNLINTLIKRSGVYYGQCSEICGANHRFMPISLEGVPIIFFSKWVKR